MKESWVCPDYFPEDWVEPETHKVLSYTRREYADGTIVWFGHSNYIETEFADRISKHIDVIEDRPPNFFPKLPPRNPLN